MSTNSIYFYYILLRSSRTRSKFSDSILRQIDRRIFVHIDLPSCMQRSLIFLRVFPHPWRNDSSLSDVVKAKSDVGCGRITENSPSKLNFPRKCRLKEQVTRFSETSCRFLRAGKRVEGRPKRESKESLLPGLTRQWIYLFEWSLWISYSFKYWRFQESRYVLVLSMIDRLIQSFDDLRFVCIESSLRIYFLPDNFMFQRLKLHFVKLIKENARIIHHYRSNERKNRCCCSFILFSMQLFTFSVYNTKIHFEKI